uniref:Uncharacterized protein n=1 Tax=Strombidium rassoulzadegani TaxID=1082188 RepID=A0A7S3FY02_9SPIT|mmetsp:Transcript_5319/g.8966  ORF Transcript_5319/g.8966 Transcript_5319/m.8966 type:complete len:238 (+) Transcript_5319:364-1077(+)
MAAMLKPQLQKNIYPESVMILKASGQFLKKRLKDLVQNKKPEEVQKWVDGKFEKKLEKFEEFNSYDQFKKNYTDPNVKDLGNFPMCKFFQENSTEVFEIEADGNKYEMFESMRIYVERFGRPYNYLASVNFLNQEREEYLVKEEQERKEQDKNQDTSNEAEIVKVKQQLQKLADERLQFVKAHMESLEGCDDLNMRQFLMKYIIPLLTEGMIEVWKVGPLDPVDYLADYIFKKSNWA